jgi:hypothetical protein
VSKSEADGDYPRHDYLSPRPRHFASSQSGFTRTRSQPYQWRECRRQHTPVPHLLGYADEAERAACGTPSEAGVPQDSGGQRCRVCVEEQARALVNKLGRIFRPPPVPGAASVGPKSLNGCHGKGAARQPPTGDAESAQRRSPARHLRRRTGRGFGTVGDQRNTFVPK